jgi:hypothetical protein
LERHFNACHGLIKKSYSTERSGEYIPIEDEQPMPKILWGVQIIASIREKFNIKKVKDSHNMALRLVDCYGLFDYLIESTNKGA